MSAYLINNTAHLIIIESMRLVPRKPVKVGDIDFIQKKYPEVKDLVSAGQIVVKGDKEGKAEVAKSEAEEVEELLAYAKSRGISVGKAKYKDSIIKAIKKAEAEAEAKAEAEKKAQD